MKNGLKKLALVASSAAASLLPVLASAQSNFNLPNTPINSINSVVASNGIICKIAGLLFFLLVIITILFVIVAAFKYLTAGGDAEKVKSANYQLVYAAVAIVVALLARGLPNIVATFVGSTNLAAGC